MMDDKPWPFDMRSFLIFVRKTYPTLTDKEHKLMARAIYAWFYGVSK